MERYTGVKFLLKKLGDKLPDTRRFLILDKIIGRLLGVKTPEGNFSLRVKNGFLIKGSGKTMGKLSRKDISFVRRIHGRVVYYSGCIPSSEARLHYRIYAKDKETKMILHFHDQRALEKGIGDLEIRKIPYGTKELADEVSKRYKREILIRLKSHGFVVGGKNWKEIKNSLMKWNLIK